MPILRNPRHERFAQELAKGKSASEAYVIAGYQQSEPNASRLTRNDKVQARVAEILSAGALRAEITIEKVLRELGKIGFSDIRRVVRWRSNLSEVGEDPDTGEPQLRAFNEVVLTDSDQIDAEAAASIAEISQTDKGALKVKLHDKRAALVDIGRHLGMFKDKVEVSGPGGGPLVPVINVSIGGTQPVSAPTAGDGSPDDCD